MRWLPVAVVLFTGFMLAMAHAHDAPSGWVYPIQCCGGNDCTPINPANVVAMSDGGYMVEGKYLVKRDDVWDSPDGQFHGCVPISGVLRCFFAPPRGM